jgi:hypothetical protein
MSEPIVRAARFYCAYRVHCCGDLEAKVMAALSLAPSGMAYDDGNLVQFSLGRLFSEQERLHGMGFDKVGRKMKEERGVVVG